MPNIVHNVWKTLDNSPSIRRCMSRGLINNTALARYLITDKKINGNLDAVSSAIRRYKLDKYDEIFDRVDKIVSFGELSTRSRLANIAVIKDAEVQELLPRLFSIIQFNRGDVLRIIQADEAIKILVNEKNLEKVKDILPKKKIIKIDQNLAELNINLHPDAIKTPVITAAISTEFAMDNINIMEFMSCVPELLFFVKEKDILKAYNALYQLCSSVDQ